MPIDGVLTYTVFVNLYRWRTDVILHNLLYLIKYFLIYLLTTQELMLFYLASQAPPPVKNMFDMNYIKVSLLKCINYFFDKFLDSFNNFVFNIYNYNNNYTALHVFGIQLTNYMGPIP